MRSLRFFSMWAGGLAAGVATVVLAAWAVGFASLPALAPGLAAMQPTTALAVGLLGVAILRPALRPLSAAALLLTLSAIAFRLELPGAWLARLPVLAGTDAMSFPTALALTFLAVGALVPRHHTTLWLPVAALATGFAGLAGYGYTVVALGRVQSFTGMSVLTATSVTLLGVGAVLARTEHPLVRYLRDQGLIGMVTRQLLLATWIIPVAAGFIRLEGERLGAYGPEVGVGIMIIVTIVTLTVTSRVTVGALVRADRLRSESDARARAIFDRAPVGLIRTLPDGTILDANPAMTRMLHIELGDLLDRNIVDFYRSPDERDRVMRLLDPRDGPVRAPWGVEVQMRAADGAELWCEVRGGPVYAEDGTLRFLEAAMMDITVRRRLGDDLQRSQRLEAAGQLAGSIAHDFNNLLTVVAANATLLRRSLPREDPRWADANEMVAVTERAAVLTRQLLVFSRGQRLDATVVHLRDVLQGLLPLLRSALGERVGLELRAAPEAWPVEVDVGQLEQVVTNLAINARDAMPDGGVLALEVDNAALDDEYGATHHDIEPGDYVRLTVTDTGAGIPPDVLPRVFEPFFTTKGDRGTGLGLASVYGIVRQHRGFIFVYSEVGIGTTFKIYLPRIHGTTSAASDRDAVPSLEGGTETVLVVDDDVAVRRVVIRLLEHLGYTVHGAGTRDEALAVLVELGDRLDLLLTDVVMPGMTGPELVTELRQAGFTRPVLYATGYSDDTVLRHHLVDMDAVVLQKPVSLEVLARKVRDVLDRSPRPE